MGIGFGIAAIDDRTLVSAIAKEIEALGYTSLWTNDTPSADSIQVARWIADATDSIQIGIGVAPIDRQNAGEIHSALIDHGIPQHRFVLGLGAGFSQSPVGDVRRAVSELRPLVSCSIAVAAMGPRMCRLAGQLADVVLLNWMTPKRITWSLPYIREGAALRSQGSPRVAAYIRAAADPSGSEAIALEASRYSALDHYKRHFDAMAQRLEEIGITAPSQLEPYLDLLDEPIVRALPRESGITSLREIARMFSRGAGI